MAIEVGLQAALATALRAAGLNAVDVAPQPADGGAAAQFPYVEIGMISLAKWDCFDRPGFDGTIRLHTRSRSAGLKELKTMQGAIYARLHRGALTLPDGYRLVDLTRQTTEVMRASDASLHGICTYRALIAETP